MFRRTSITFAVLALAAAGPLAHTARAVEFDWDKKRAALGRQDKFRVLVDKVLSLSNKWVLTEKHMDEIRDADFNVIVPRVGCEDMKRVARVADMARKRGMFYMAWMRGTRSAKTGTKLVWANGAVQDLYSPNADELWTWMTKLILGHARLSTTNPAIVGSFLDFENYAKGSQGNCYALSYDEKILAEFAKAAKLNVPELAPAERHPWLKDKGHLAAFRDFQIESWRRRCRELRRQIDAVNPRFQLIVYPRSTLFLHEAIYPEWATQAAPLIFADHITYNRPGRLPHAEGLATNRRALKGGIRFAELKNVPLLYISGIDPIYKEADPEFCGRNAAMISETCDGYWIFYEGPDYHKDHPDYFNWFARANRAIIDHRFDFWTQPRETPDPIMAAREKLLKTYCGAAVKPFSADSMPTEEADRTFTVRTRSGDNTIFCVLLKAGEELDGRLEVRRLGSYTGGCAFTVYGPDRQVIAKGNAELDRPASLNCSAKQAGLHLITVNTSSNAARLVVRNQYFCLIGAASTGLLASQPRTWFLPAPNAHQASFTLASPSPGETARITILDPAGNEVAHADTVTNKKVTAKFAIPPDQADKLWSFKIGPASKGALEDLSITRDAGCAPFLATHPSRMITSAK